MSSLVIHQPSVLIGTVPLYAVNSIRLTEQYALPEVGAQGMSQSTAKITRTIDIDAVLIGDDRLMTRVALEHMADLSKTLPALQPIVNGIPLVAGLTTLLDCQISSLTFTQSATDKETFAVSIQLKHCPRPGLMAMLSELTSAAAAIQGAPRLASGRPRKAQTGAATIIRNVALVARLA
jgi:hypothetical protein